MSLPGARCLLLSASQEKLHTTLHPYFTTGAVFSLKLGVRQVADERVLKQGSTATGRFEVEGGVKNLV